LKAQAAQENQLVPVKSEPAKKKIQSEIVFPTVKKDLFHKQQRQQQQQQQHRHQSQLL
jgi:hypothetical protein